MTDLYWTFADTYYRTPEGEPLGELPHLRTVIRVLVENYGDTAAASFGPKALRAVREQAAWTEIQVRYLTRISTNRMPPAGTTSSLALPAAPTAPAPALSRPRHQPLARRQPVRSLEHPLPVQHWRAGARKAGSHGHSRG